MFEQESRTVGIVGGYGHIGFEAAKILSKTESLRVVIGGRDKDKCGAAARELGGGVAPAVVDYEDPESLDGFLDGLDLVINCAGPSKKIGTTIAFAALGKNVHYVDSGGYDNLFSSLSGIRGEVESKGLRFIVSAGMFPGLSEVFPAFIAESFFDEIDSLDYFYAGAGGFSFNSAYDMIHAVFENKGGAGCYWEGGAIKQENCPTRVYELPGPAGQLECNLSLNNNILRIAEAHNIKSVRFFNTLSGNMTRKALHQIWLSGEPGTESEKNYLADLLMKASKKDMGGTAAYEMLHLVMSGREGNNPKEITSTISVERGYALSGMVAALTALGTLNGAAKSGCRFLDQAFDCGEFMELLGNYGLDLEIS